MKINSDSCGATDPFVSVDSLADIPSSLHGTPFEELLRYHNLREPHIPCVLPKMVIGMCMDHRTRLRMPENFAYVLRSGGGNMRYSEFKLSYAIAVGKVQAIALIAHTNCGMVNVQSRKEAFVQGLVDMGGWERAAAEEHFYQFAPQFEIGDAHDFVVAEARRLRARYRKVSVLPLMYRVEDNKLYLLRDDVGSEVLSDSEHYALSELRQAVR